MYLWGKNLEKHTLTHHLFIMSSLAAADPYAWKDAGFEGQCAVIMGYGGGVSDKVLQVLTESGMKVAIVSRTQAKLVRAIPLAKSFSAPSLCLTPSPLTPFLSCLETGRGGRKVQKAGVFRPEAPGPVSHVQRTSTISE